MPIREFFKKVVVPAGAILFLYILFRPLCLEHSVCDYRKLLLLMGIPFGIQKMFVWIFPGKFDIGGTVGILAFNFLIGGVIGSLVLLWRMAVAVIYLVIGAGSGITWVVGKIGRQSLG